MTMRSFENGRWCMRLGGGSALAAALIAFTNPVVAQPQPGQDPPSAPVQPVAPEPTPAQPPPAATTPPAATPPPTGVGSPATPPAAGTPVEPAAGEGPAAAGEVKEGEGEAKEKEKSWYEIIALSAFVDAYFSVNYRFPKPQSGTNLYRGFDANNGFSLSWAGIDAAIEPDPVGMQISLRLGPSTAGIAGTDGDFQYVTQAYGQWRPGGKDGRVTLIAGKFYTPYGGEAIEAQYNMAYTLGLVPWLSQPAFHTGLRSDIKIADPVTMKLLVVNGWNNTIDNNIGKTFGAHFVFTPIDQLTISAGYLGGPEEDDVEDIECPPEFDYNPLTNACDIPGTGVGATLDRPSANSRWRHLADLVVDVNPTDTFRILFNGTFVTQNALVGEEEGSLDTTYQTFFGASLQTRYQFHENFAAAIRGELYHDDSGFTTGLDGAATLGSGTIVLEASPTPMFVVRLETRGDFAGQAIFPGGIDDTHKNQITTTLGVIAKTE
jgi:Putative beta-barrel porin-2, OmpL-like. bbp2